MERESNSMQALCRSGCGFYGSPATDGLCSLCFKENLKKKQQLPNNTPSSLSTYRDTSAAQHAISHLPSTPANLTSNAGNGSSNSLTGTATSDECAAAAIAAAAAACASSSTVAAELCAVAAQQESAAAAVAASVSASADVEDKQQQEDAKKKKNRCASCRKKVGLTGFECRCGGLYCAVHRYSDKHECQFDYRELGAQEIRRNNPVVVGEKIQKI